jgi:LacI family transcriptional regulator, galactose operon repressor
MVQKNRHPGLKDVAKLAKTSIATASRAISGRGYIDEKTKRVVLEAARILNYQPNLQARNLRRQSSCIIGLIIPNLLNAYYTALADLLSQFLNEKGYHLWLASTQDESSIEKDMLYDMLGYPVEGLIWVPSGGDDDNLLEYIKSRRIPAVTIVRRVHNDMLDTIVFQDKAGTEMAIQHLINLGHKRIAYIGGDTRHSSNHDRWDGYITALEAAGLASDDELVKLGSNWSTLGEMATNELFQLPERPTAIFVASNAIMPGVLRTLQHHQVNIPNDISLICFDDLDWFAFYVPPITAITHDHSKLANAAVDLLMKRIEGNQEQKAPSKSLFITIDFDLVLRKSTAPPPGLPNSDGHWHPVR